MSSQEQNTTVLRAAGAMGAATLISRIMGLVREQAFAFLFGASNATDAFNVAFRIPNLLRDLFAEGAMSASLVPTFTQTRERQGPEQAWRVAGLVFRVLFILVGLISLLGIVFAPELVSLYAGAFRDTPGKFDLTVRMTRLMFPFFPLVALAAAFMGILNACGMFFLPAFASALFNVASVIVGVGCAYAITAWGTSYGIHPIEGMAVGVVAGGLVQAFSQLPALYRHGYHWVARGSTDPAWHADTRLRRMLWMMIPGTVGLAATQINILVNTMLATSQGPGAVSYLNFAFRLMQFPIGIFGVSLAAATLPQISRLWVKQDHDAIQDTLTQSLKQVLAINLPAAAGLAFLSFPIIQLIFQYGRFTVDATEATATALIMYSIGLAAYSAVKVLVPACYAVGNTRLPVLSSVLAVVVTIVLNLIMVGPFGYWGLALGTSIAAIVNAGFLLISLRRILERSGGRLPLLPVFKSLIVNSGLAITMGVVCWLSYRGLVHWLPDPQVGVLIVRGLRLGMVIAEGVVVLVVLARMLGVREAHEAFDLFAGKIKKKLRRRST